jgi:putative transposase
MLVVSGFLIQLIGETLRACQLTDRSTQSIKAENSFLRRQLALYVKRGIKPRRIDPVTRIALALLSRFFNWRDALVAVRPETMIRRMANENPAWGEQRIANELLLKLGIQVSPRTVRKYPPRHPPGRHRGDLRWSTFLRLHAQRIIACDFLLVVTAAFRLLYLFVVIEHRSRRLVHYNVTTHPSSVWTLQQLRETVGLEGQYEYFLAPAGT